MPSVFNTIEYYMTEPFRRVGSAIYDSPILGDSLHIVDSMVVAGRGVSEAVRDEAPVLVREVASAVPSVINTAEEVVEGIGSSAVGLGNILSSPYLVPGLVVGAVFLMRE